MEAALDRAGAEEVEPEDIEDTVDVGDSVDDAKCCENAEDIDVLFFPREGGKWIAH